jgi:hypothetical protein
MDKINLIITCYDGARRQKYNNSISNLKLQNYTLNNFKHSISQVTLVCTTDSNYSNTFKSEISEFEKSSKFKTEILFRENVGASYGSFNHAYLRYRTDFDQYIFLEDDYVFSCDYFDEIMMSKMYLSENCGFVCSLADKTNNPHAAISVGMINTKALEKIINDKGQLSFAGDNVYRGESGHEYAGQYLFSKDIIDSGFNIVDCTPDYDSWFFGCQDNNDTVMCFSETTKNKHFVVPVQIFKDLNSGKQLPVTKNEFLSRHYNYSVYSCGIQGLSYLQSYLEEN